MTCCSKERDISHADTKQSYPHETAGTYVGVCKAGAFLATLLHRDAASRPGRLVPGTRFVGYRVTEDYEIS